MNKNQRQRSGSIKNRRTKVPASSDTAIGSGVQSSLKSHYNGIKNKKVNKDFQFDFADDFQDINQIKNGSQENKNPNELKKDTKNGGVLTQVSSQTTQICSQLSSSTNNLLSKYAKNRNDLSQLTVSQKILEEPESDEKSLKAQSSKKASPINQKSGNKSKKSTKKRKLENLEGNNEIDEKREIKKFKDQNDQNNEMVNSDSMVSINSSKAKKSKQSQIKAQQNKQVVAVLSDSTKNLVSKLLNDKNNGKVSKTQQKMNEEIKIVVDKKTLLPESNQNLQESIDQIDSNLKSTKISGANFSESTKNLINNLKAQRSSNPDCGVKITKNDDESQVNMREKHQELLSVQRKLVIPQKYKPFLMMVNNIDTTINMFKSRNRNSSLIRTDQSQSPAVSDDSFVNFKEIQKSIAGSIAKSLSLNMFRQILSIVPQFYQHKWQWINKISVTEPQLMLNFDNAFDLSTSKEQMRYTDLTKRQNFMENELIKITKQAHDEFLDELEKTEEISVIFRDPIKYQMWYNKFNPHTSDYIKDIPISQLSPYPEHKIKHNTQSIKDYLVVQKPQSPGRRSRGRSSIAREAIRNASNDSTAGKSSPQLFNRVNQIGTRRSKQKSQIQQNDVVQEKLNEEETKKMEKMSTTYGISVETLRLVQKKKAENDVKNAQLQAQSDATQGERGYQELSKVQDGIRQQFMTRGKATINLQELATNLVSNRGMNQQFLSKSQVITNICKLAKLIPEFIEIKSIVIRGKQEKLVKLQKQISATHQIQQYQQGLTALQINQLIRERLQLDKQ